MNPVDLIVVIVIVAILGLAAWYVHKSKKSGKKCIGCPDGCTSQCGSCSCNCSGKH